MMNCPVCLSDLTPIMLERRQTTLTCKNTECPMSYVPMTQSDWGLMTEMIAVRVVKAMRGEAGSYPSAEVACVQTEQK